MGAQTAVNTDTFIADVMSTLMHGMNMWIDEQKRLNDVKMALYMNLNNKTILASNAAEQLPAEYVDDTFIIIERFLRYMEIEEHTESTIVNYRGEIRNFFLFARKNYADITKMDVMAYLSQKKKIDGNGDVTLNNKIHVLKSFYSWVMDEDTVEEGGCLGRKPSKNPMSKIKKIKQEKKLKTVLEDEEVEIIRCGCKHLRDRAIVEIFAATGMRVSELIGLNVDDIDVTKKRCIIYGKGRKERPAFFTPRAIVHLKAYLEWRRQLPDACDALIINLRKTNGVYGRMGACSIRKMLDAIVENDPRLEGINLHPHRFRAYLATYMSRHGATVQEIARVLGHSNINTTYECYLLESIDDTQAVHQKCVA